MTPLVFDGHLPTYVAIVEANGELLKFLQWYSASGNAPNISVLAMQGMPSGRCRKGGRQKLKRVKESTVSETFVSVNRFVPPLTAPPSQPSLPAHCLPPPSQTQQSQVHGNGNVNVASGTASTQLAPSPHKNGPSRTVSAS